MFIHLFMVTALRGLESKCQVCSCISCSISSIGSQTVPFHVVYQCVRRSDHFLFNDDINEQTDGTHCLLILNCFCADQPYEASSSDTEIP